MEPGPDALDPSQRELLRRLVRGQPTEEVADALGTTVETLEADARAALAALDPALAALVTPDERRVVAAHVLRRSNQHGAVAEVLDASPDARRWAIWLAEALRVIAPDAPPVQLMADIAAATQAVNDRDDATADNAERHDHGVMTADGPMGGAAGAATPDTTRSSAVVIDARLSPADWGILVATVVMGFALLALGILLS